MADEFDWSKAAELALPEQLAIAFYRNADGDLVIRQHAAWSEQEDSVIIISPNNEQQFIDKLTDFLGIPSAP